MKKFFLLLIIFPLLAVDLKGKFGIGFGFNMPVSFRYYFPSPEWVCGKIGISSKFAIEPYALLDYFSQEKYLLKWGIGGILDYAYFSKEKSNLYLKGGTKFESFLSKENWKYSNTEFVIGLGVEIWWSKNFSVDFSACTEFTYHKNYEKSTSSFSAYFRYPFALIFYY